jgi:short-subunit dehydrogenase
MRFARRLLGSGLVAGGVCWFMRYVRPRHSTLVLDGNVVLITGASSGIGRALAYAFARRAAHVVLVARSVERLEAVRREIEPYTAQVLVIPADISDEAQLQHVVDRTLETFGRIDVLVNNAGLTRGGRFEEQDPAHIDQLLRVNLWATMRLTQLVLPSMLSQHHGYILNVGSGLARLAMPLFVPFVASKYGVAGFTDALRRELDGTGVHMTLVLPGWTHTDMLSVEVEDVLERYGFRVENADEVAERAVLGLVRGENEVVFGGALIRIGVLVERYAPVLVRLYWRLRMTPEWMDAMRRVGD